VILDGKVVDSDRCHEKTISRKGREIDLRYSGKKHDFGGNIQAVFYPDGIPMRVSDVLPGNVHDLSAARENVLGVLRPFLDAMPALADCGYEGAGHGIHVPVKRPAGVKELDIGTRTRNALLTSARCLGERGFALLTQRWKPSSTSPPAPANRPHRPRRTRPGAIRAQNAHVKVAEKTSLAPSRWQIRTRVDCEAPFSRASPGREFP
jgi:DDE superfamily endonuclease